MKPIPLLALCLAPLLSSCTEGLKKELAEVKQRADGATSKAAQLETELKQTSARAKLAEQQAEQRLTEATQRIATLASEATARRTDLEAKAARITSVEAALGEAHSRMAALAAELTTMKERAAVAEAKVGMYEADRAKAAKAVEEEAKKAIFTAQLGVTMRSGETKPVANTSVFLTKQRLADIAPGSYPGEYGKPALASHVLSFPVLYQRSAREIVARIEAAAVAKATTDFSGRVKFEGIDPGDYYIISTTPLGGGGGGGVVFQKRVRVEGHNGNVSLNNEDILDRI